MAFQWKSDIKPTDKNLDEANLDFVFHEARLRLRSTVESYDALTNKANAFLAFVSAVSAAVVAFIANGNAHAFWWPLLAYLVVSVVAVYFAFHTLWAKQIDVEGYCPELLFQKEFMRKKPKELKARLLKRYGEKIAWNIEVTDGMGASLRNALVCYAVACALLIVLGLQATSLSLVRRGIAFGSEVTRGQHGVCPWGR